MRERVFVVWRKKILVKICYFGGGRFSDLRYCKLTSESS